MNLQEQTNRIRKMMGLHEERLLAPNGNPSNLSPELYQLVRTSEFKNWFGDWENNPQNASKVIDENGEPLIVYHGGTFNINIDIPKKGMHFGTKNAAEQRGYDKQIEDMVLSMIFKENGKYYVDINDIEHYPSFRTKQDAIDYVYSNYMNEYQGDMDDNDTIITSAFLNLRNPYTSSDRKNRWSKAIKEAVSSKHDGIVYINHYEDKGSKSFIIFKPEQIKSTN